MTAGASQPAAGGRGGGHGGRADQARLHVDFIACDGRGLCAEILPEMITLDDWGFPMIADGRVPARLLADARAAVMVVIGLLTLGFGIAALIVETSWALLVPMMIGVVILWAMALMHDAGYLAPEQATRPA
jgi:ferredoxin